VGRSNSSRAALECRGGLFCRLWCISWQGLDRSGQQEAFQLCGLLAISSESKSTLGSTGGRPRHSAVTGIVPGDVPGRIEDVRHEAGRFDANGPAELHALLETAENGSREDVLGTLLPGGYGTTRLDFVTEDQPNEDVQAPEGEEEEGRDEGEAVNMMGENRSPNQALDDAESTDAKVVSKNGEEPIEEARGPTDFGKEEDNDLSDDQETVEDGPEDAGWLVGNGRVRDIIVAHCRRVV